MNGEIFRTQVDSDGLHGARLMVVREYRIMWLYLSPESWPSFPGLARHLSQGWTLIHSFGSCFNLDGLCRIEWGNQCQVGGSAAGLILQWSSLDHFLQGHMMSVHKCPY